MNKQIPEYVICTHCGHKMSSLFAWKETIEYFCHACDKRFIDDPREITEVK